MTVINGIRHSAFRALSSIGTLPVPYLHTNFSKLRLHTSIVSAMTSNGQKSDFTKWASDDGHFRRQVSTFRDTIDPNGFFTPESARDHLYVRMDIGVDHSTFADRHFTGLLCLSLGPSHSGGA